MIGHSHNKLEVKGYLLEKQETVTVGRSVRREGLALT